MKKIYLGIVLLIAIFPQALFAQQGFEISGHLEGLKDGEIIVLGNRFADFHDITRTDSCKVVHGDFHLKGASVPQGPRLYEVVFDEGRHRRLSSNSFRNIGGISCLLLIENGQKIFIRGGDINKMRDSDFSGEVSIEGSPSTTAMAQLMPLFYSYVNYIGLMDRQLEKIRDSIGFEPSLFQGYIQSKAIFDDALGRVVTAPSSAGYKTAIPYFLSLFDNYHGEFLPYAYNNLDSVERNSYYGKILNENARLAIGQPLPGFTLPTLEKKMISLKETDKSNKVTLVHIWASNSVEKEHYQKELRMVYKQYHDKGLGIIGISADTAEDDWRKWELVERYPWVNVSDLKGHMTGGIVQDVYHEGGHQVPNTTNILLDAEGRIIAWDINGPELLWYLKTLLGN